MSAATSSEWPTRRVSTSMTVYGGGSGLVVMRPTGFVKPAIHQGSGLYLALLISKGHWPTHRRAMPILPSACKECCVISTNCDYFRIQSILLKLVRPRTRKKENKKTEGLYGNKRLAVTLRLLTTVMNELKNSSTLPLYRVSVWAWLSNLFNAFRNEPFFVFRFFNTISFVADSSLILYLQVLPMPKLYFIVVVWIRYFPLRSMLLVEFNYFHGSARFDNMLCCFVRNIHTLWRLREAEPIGAKILALTSPRRTVARRPVGFPRGHEESERKIQMVFWCASMEFCQCRYTTAHKNVASISPLTMRCLHRSTPNCQWPP